MAAHRSSDRWITPGVVMVGLCVAGVVVLGIGAGVTYLTARGVDPDPMLRLVAQVVTAAGSLGTLLLQLIGRTTVAKVERNTGVLADNVADVIDAVQSRPQPADDYPGSDYPAHDYDVTAATPRVAVPAVPPMPAHLMRSPRP